MESLKCGECKEGKEGVPAYGGEGEEVCKDCFVEGVNKQLSFLWTMQALAGLALGSIGGITLFLMKRAG